VKNDIDLTTAAFYMSKRQRVEDKRVKDASYMVAGSFQKLCYFLQKASKQFLVRTEMWQPVIETSSLLSLNILKND
jgi:hypothetical protein